MSAMSALLLDDFDNTTLQRRATDSRNQFNTYLPIAISAGVLGTAGVIAGAVLWNHAKPRQNHQ